MREAAVITEPAKGKQIDPFVSLAVSGKLFAVNEYQDNITLLLLYTALDAFIAHIHVRNPAGGCCRANRLSCRFVSLVFLMRSIPLLNSIQSLPPCGCKQGGRLWSAPFGHSSSVQIHSRWICAASGHVLPLTPGLEGILPSWRARRPPSQGNRPRDSWGTDLNLSPPSSVLTSI